MLGSSVLWNRRLGKLRVIDVNDPCVEHELEVGENEKCVHGKHAQEGSPPVVVDEKCHISLLSLGIGIVGT